MADKEGFYVVILCCVFLLSECPLKTFGEEKDTRKEGGNSDAITTGQMERVNGIAPGEVVISNIDGKTTDGEKALDGEKKVEIKQSEDGKTTEEVKAQEDIKQPEEEGGKEGEKDKEEEKTDSKEEEKDKKEPGIDLKFLKDEDFEHLTQASSGATTGDWLVLFSETDNENCTEAEKELKKVYERLKHKLNVAKVEKGTFTKLTFRRFRIKDLPTILLFHNGKKFTFEDNYKSEDELINFVEGKYQLMRWAVVRDPYTSFELFAEETFEDLQHMLRYKKNVSIVIFVTGVVFGLSSTSICGSILFHILENFKDDDEEEIMEGKQPKSTKNKAE